MRLPSGDLSETDEDNAKVFVQNFGKVLNNKKSINNNVLYSITPELATRNAILHSIRADQHPPSQETLMNLKTPQQEVDEIIEIC